MDEREMPEYPGAGRPGHADKPGERSPGPDSRWGIPLIFLAVVLALWLSFRLVPDLGALFDDLPIFSQSPNPTLPIDAVAKTTPAPQSLPSSATGSTFVPNLQQSGQKRALDLLEQHKLFAEIEEIFDDKVAPGLVVSQSPEPNTSVAVGTTVIVRISKGPENPEMPDVEGLTVESAREQLGLLGVEVEEIEQASATIAAGIVLNQDPPAGAPVEAESTVRLIVSKGVDRVPVPDVRNSQLAFAQANLAAVGLRGRLNITLTNDPGTCGTVASQSPEPYTPVELDSEIALNVRGQPGCTPPQ